MSPRIFFITGVSTGFGNELVKKVIASGDVAIGTSRNPASVSFEGATSANFLAIKMDVTDEQSVEAAFVLAVKTFGRVDVVVSLRSVGRIVG